MGSGLLKNCGALILDRKFENTGSHIATMYKDLGISMAMARENGCAVFTAATAYELFQTGMSLYPEGDNWAIVNAVSTRGGSSGEWTTLTLKVPEWARGAETQIEFRLYDHGQETRPMVHLRNIGNRPAVP